MKNFIIVSNYGYQAIPYNKDNFFFFLHKHYIWKANRWLNHLFPESDTPLNLSRSLALARSTAPGSLSFPVNLALFELLIVSELILSLGT